MDTLSIDENSYNDSNVYCHPTHTWQVDDLVLFLYPETKPKDCRGEICAPRQKRYPGRLLANPNGQNLWNRHEHREDGHTSE
jgi:hypothetical protein